MEIHFRRIPDTVPKVARMMFGGGGVLAQGFPHVNLTHNPHPHEHFNVAVPFTRQVGGFHAPMSARVVAVAGGGDNSSGNDRGRFTVDLDTTAGETFLRVEARFHDRQLTMNSTASGRVWQVEERVGGDFPFTPGQVFTLDMVAESDAVKILVDGAQLAEFAHRDDASDVAALRVAGDLRVHSIGVSHHSHHHCGGGGSGQHGVHNTEHS